MFTLVIASRSLQYKPVAKDRRFISSVTHGVAVDSKSGVSNDFLEGYQCFDVLRAQATWHDWLGRGIVYGAQSDISYGAL